MSIYCPEYSEFVNTNNFMDFFPNSGTSVFKIGEYPQLNACLNYQENNWEAYAEGYLNASLCLISRVTKNTYSPPQDIIIYPAIYLFRQYLELRIKIIIIDGNYL